MAKGTRINIKAANMENCTPESLETKASTNGLCSNKARLEINTFSDRVNSTQSPSKDASDGTSETSDIEVVDQQAK